MLRCSVLAVLISATFARIHNLHIKNDDRILFTIESFGFLAGGTLQYDVTGYKLESSKGVIPTASLSGFALLQAGSDQDVYETLEAALQAKTCILSNPAAGTFVSTDIMNTTAAGETLSRIITVQESGLYALVHAICVPAGSSVWFSMKYVFKNPNDNYLTSGELPLPTVFAAFSGLFCIALVAWGILLHRRWQRASRIHTFMAALLIVKVLSLFFEAGMYYHIARVGHTEGWTIMYDIVGFVKGTMLFMVIVLLGTGWSNLKPFLSDRERKVLVIILPLQIIENVAYIVVSELAPGDSSFVSWTNILHVVDIVCCCLVIFPIFWSIHHLREAAAADGKARDTLERLKKFREFYLVIVSYVYFTRIVLLVLSAMISYELSWTIAVLAESAAILLFVWTGYTFQPPAAIEYSGVPLEEATGGEAQDED